MHLTFSLPSSLCLFFPEAGSFSSMFPFNVMLVISVLQVPRSESCLFSFSKPLVLVEGRGSLCSRAPVPGFVWNHKRVLDPLLGPN